MNGLRFTIRIIFLLMLLSFGSTINGQNEYVTYDGQLKIGKTESTIIYLGAETGDLAAFCFPNKSTVGRAIFSKCKDGQQCRFTGRVDWNKDCDIAGGLFSARARIISVTSVRKIVRRK